MNETIKTDSGAHSSAVTPIYELQYFAFWPGPWYLARPGKLGDLIRKHRPAAIVRIR
jgi:hypothetical protein